jgi:hypothetical protein
LHGSRPAVWKDIFQAALFFARLEMEEDEAIKEIERRFEPILTLFFAGRLPRFNHARHISVANILSHLPHGRELMHLGLQITATRAGVPERYSREITDFYWERLNGALPEVADFADVLESADANAPSLDSAAG